MSNQENIYEFFKDFGRMGEIEGVFIASPKDVAEMVAKEPTLYLGEVLGKHSEVVIELTSDDITLKSENQEAVRIVKEIFGGNVSGYNPFDYYEEE